jgi:putative tryptophan/tyrosine transport system substrate-binding protein
MRRRELIMLLGGATAWPLAVRAQRLMMPVIGFLNSRSKFKGEPVAAAFRRGLREAGYEEGRNVAVEYRWAEDQYEHLPALAVDLVTRGVAAIVAGGGAWVAAKQATTSIPIVFTTGLDPVRAGMVKSINRPEANLTGATFYSGGAIIAKQLELLREMVPNVTEVAMLVHTSSPTAESQMHDAVVAARQNGMALQIVNVADAPGLDAAFTAIQANALVIMVDPFFDSRAAEIVAGSARRHLPTMYYIREIRGGWRAHLLRCEHPRDLSSGWILCGPRSRRSQACRPAGRAANQVRVDHQPQDCKGARPQRASDAARQRRRGDRIGTQLAAV